MLIVNTNTLQAVNVLHFVDDILRERFDALETQDIVWRRWAFRHNLTLLDVFTFENSHCAPLGNKHLVMIAAVDWVDSILWRYHKATLTLGFFAVANRSRNFSENRRLFWLARFEQVGNTRQTTRNISSLRALLRNSRNNVTNVQRRAIFQ